MTHRGCISCIFHLSYLLVANLAFINITSRIDLIERLLPTQSGHWKRKLELELYIFNLYLRNKKQLQQLEGNMTMKIMSLLVGLILYINTITVRAEQMDNSFVTWDDFVRGFGGEMVGAEDVFNSMVKNGLQDYSLQKFDFHFVSTHRKKLKELSAFIATFYPYSLEPIIERDDHLWELTGLTNKFPVTSDNLLYWVLDMYKRGYEFDAELEGYGAGVDSKNPKFPEFIKTKEDYYFYQGVDRYTSGNLSGAIFSWTNVIRINPKEPNSFYSRAIVKNELYTWKSALRDYDKSIELAPNFISAILNRGSLKADNSDNEGAIEDYNLLLNLSHANQEDRQKAYFNRGNSHHRLNNIENACVDWKNSKELGAEYAAISIEKYCK